MAKNFAWKKREDGTIYVSPFETESYIEVIAKTYEIKEGKNGWWLKVDGEVVVKNATKKEVKDEAEYQILIDRKSREEHIKCLVRLDAKERAIQRIRALRGSKKTRQTHAEREAERKRDAEMLGVRHIPHDEMGWPLPEEDSEDSEEFSSAQHNNDDADGTVPSKTLKKKGKKKMATTKSPKAEKVLSVKKAEALALFNALGFKSTASWTDARLLEKLKALDETCDEDTANKKKLEKSLATLLNSILDALESKSNIVLEIPAAKPDKAAAKAVAGKKGTKKASDDDEDEDDSDDDEDDEDEDDSDDDEDEDDSDDDEDDEDEDDSDDDEDEDDSDDDEDEDDSDDDEDEEPAPKKKGKEAKTEKANKKPGVCAVIMEEFGKGSKNSPVTKDTVMKVLKKKFPERPEAGMRSTLNAAPSWMVSWKNLEVGTDGKGGYWIKKPKK